MPAIWQLLLRCRVGLRPRVRLLLRESSSGLAKADELRQKLRCVFYQYIRNFVKLEPDVAAVFPDDVTVNEALRYLIRDSKENGEGFFSIQQPKTK